MFRYFRGSIASVFIIFVIISPSSAFSESTAVASWEFHMTEYGSSVCNVLSDNRVDFQSKLKSIDYDAIWVFYQIYRYTLNPVWLDCAKEARKIYRDQYLTRKLNSISYDRLFVHGLLQDYNYYSTNRTKKALGTILKRANQFVHQEPIARVENSREAAQALMTMLALRGDSDHSSEKQQQLLEAVIFHIRSWLTSTGVEFVPYLTGISAEALIQYDQEIGDARILPLLEQLAQKLWLDAWLPHKASFYYRQYSPEPAPDLNLLIAPLYSWLAHKTGNENYANQGIEIFNGGVNYAWLASGKHFNQNYRWSFSFLEWLVLPSEMPSRPDEPISTPTPTTIPAARPTATPVPTPTLSNPDPVEQGNVNRAIPKLATWESNMLTYGRKNCEYIKSNATFDEKLLSNYYDAQWVFYQIYDYTRDSYWLNCAEVAQQIYGEQYALANDGYLPGYWQFTHGLTEDYLRNSDSRARVAVVKISTNAAYARDTTQSYETEHTDYSRETAYSIMSYLNAEKVGEPRRARLSKLVDDALGHLDSWGISRSSNYVRPFMVGLTAHALIMYSQQTGDSRVIEPIRKNLDFLWNNLWIQGELAFQYTDKNLASGGTEAAPDLNLLLAPAYIWMYTQTGETQYKDRADLIFEGGVTNAYLQQGKQFNQNYRWSFEYVRLRSQ